MKRCCSMLRERFREMPAIVHLLDRLEARHLYQACFVLTIDIGEERRQESSTAFITTRCSARGGAARLRAAAGFEPHQIIIYCPSFGCRCRKPRFRCGMEGGELLPLSGSNNEEIRILKEKHKALWKFFVLIDRDVWDRAGSACAARPPNTLEWTMICIPDDFFHIFLSVFSARRRHDADPVFHFAAQHRQ